MKREKNLVWELVKPRTFQQSLFEREKEQKGKEKE